MFDPHLRFKGVTFDPRVHTYIHNGQVKFQWGNPNFDTLQLLNFAFNRHTNWRSCLSVIWCAKFLHTTFLGCRYKQNKLLLISMRASAVTHLIPIFKTNNVTADAHTVFPPMKWRVRMLPRRDLSVERGDNGRPNCAPPQLSIPSFKLFRSFVLFFLLGTDWYRVNCLTT